MNRTYPIDSFAFIREVAHALVNMALEAEGAESWEKRHISKRALAFDLYGDSDEADIFNMAMTLHQN